MTQFVARTRVEVVEGGARTIDVPRRGLVVGRSPTNDLVLDVASVSAKHGRIFFLGDDLFYEDLKSSYGSQRDGEELTQPTLLEDGDELLLGGAVVLRIHLVGPRRFGAQLAELADTQHSLSPVVAGAAEARPFSLDLLPVVESFASATSVAELASRAALVGLTRFAASRSALLELEGSLPARVDDAVEAVRERGLRVLALHGAADPGFVSRTVVLDALRRGVACHSLFGGVQPSLSLAASGATSAIAALVRARDGKVRLLYLDTLGPQSPLGWSHATTLQVVSAHTAAAFDALATQREIAHHRLRFEQLRRFFSPAVADHLLKHPDQIGPHVGHAVVLFADLSGYTALGERLPPERLFSIVNRWLDAGAHAVMAHGGTLDKFIGDAIMAVFGAPLETPDPELSAVHCALAMRDLMAPLSQEIGERFNLTVGINAGPVAAGTLGSRRRVEYTVLGDTVNVASRLQGRAEPGEILIGSAVASRVGGSVVLAPAGLLELKNHAPVEAFRVLRAV